MLNTSLSDIRDVIPHRRLVFTGPIDEFFDFRYGRLPYRSLRFDHVSLNEEWHQPVAVVNYPRDQAYTRVTEYKHLTGQQHPRTSLTYEYPCDEGDPYYPIPRARNQEQFKLYERLARNRPDVTFIGRLATYRYYNMDQVVGQALSAYKQMTQDGTPMQLTAIAPEVVGEAACLTAQ
jgi:UDP-galactopyranose mutase